MGITETNGVKKKSQLNKEYVSNKKKSKKKGTKKIVSKKEKSQKRYNVQDITNALNAISKGKSFREAAKTFGVPKTTLYCKMNNLSPLDCRKGPQTVLSKSEEEHIVNCILESAERGFPITKQQILGCVQTFVIDSGKKTPFKDDSPGKFWYKSFIRRHEKLRVKMAKSQTSSRTSVNEAELRKWFGNVNLYLKQKGISITNPDRIFYLDEFSFQLVSKDNTGIIEKGARPVCRIEGCREKTRVNVLFNVAASGQITTPMMAFDLKTVPNRNILGQIPEGWGVGKTIDGWTTGESFYCYMVNIFFQWLRNNNIPFPVIVFLNKHTSHLTLPLLKFCKENSIELIALFPNLKHIYLPLDTSFICLFKLKFKELLAKWKLENNVVHFKKFMVAPVLTLTLDSADFSESIINGFRSSGLFPFDADAVNYNISKKPKKTIISKQIISLGSAKTKTIDQTNKQHLDFFEQNIITADILKMFKQNEFEKSWSGELSLQGLFESWRKMKKLCENTNKKETQKKGSLNSVVDKSLPASFSDCDIQILSEGEKTCILNFQDVKRKNSMESYTDFQDKSIESNPPLKEIEFYDPSGQRHLATIIEVQRCEKNNDPLM